MCYNIWKRMVGTCDRASKYSRGDGKILWRKKNLTVIRASILYSLTLSRKLIKICISFSSISPIFSLVLIPDSAFSTALEQRVCWDQYVLSMVANVCTDPLFYDVYSRIAEIHLTDIGLGVQWIDVDVRPQSYDERWAKSKEYFTAPIYRLPLAYLSTSLS